MLSERLTRATAPDRRQEASGRAGRLQWAPRHRAPITARLQASWRLQAICRQVGRTDGR
jgi:hypothetical protein